MTPRNFPPADQCTAEDLDAIADLVVRDPSASWDLAGSREHIEALCRRYQALAQDLESARQAIADREDEIGRINNARQAEVNEAAAQRERADEAESIAEIFEATARAALTILGRGTGRSVELAELVRAVDGRVARALVRERKISAALGNQLERTAMLLDEQQETLRHNDRIQAGLVVACGAIGKSIEQVNLELDDELAAHPDVGPLHHARDQRDDQEDTTP